MTCKLLLAEFAVGEHLAKIAHFVKMLAQSVYDLLKERGLAPGCLTKAHKG